MACEGLKTCENPGNYCPDNRFSLGACQALPLDLRFNPGAFFAGVPNVPPVLEKIFDLECPMDSETGVVISSQSGQSFYRTTDPIFNQRYRARLFVFQANMAGSYTVTLTNASFSPFITASRDFATNWQIAGTTLNFTVAADQTGPITLEVTTQTPQIFGSFDLALTCMSCILGYWKMETFSIPLDFGFNTTPDSAGSNRLLGNPTATVIPGKIGNGLRLANQLQNQSMNYFDDAMTFRFWFFPVGTSGNEETFVDHENDSITGGWRIYKRAGDSNVLTARFINSSGSWETGQSGGYLLGQWNRCVLRRNKVGDLADIRINNGVPGVGLIPSGITGVAGSFSIRKNVICGDYDEATYYKGCSWTDDQMFYDWNGGVGRTHPDVPP